MQIADQNFTLIVYGASGSLAKLKIFPAIYQLALEGRLDDVDYKIVGYARSEIASADFRKTFAESVKKAVHDVDEKILSSLLEHVHYFTGQYDVEADFQKLADWLPSIEGDKDCVRIGYFSVPPSVFPDIIKNSCKRFDTEFGKIRLILEKPFGYNLKTAKELEEHLMDCYEEEQLYLLDHYLGKEAVFNVLSLRYANSILTTLIKGKHVANIQITGFEPVGIEGRAGYFDNVGILRDMIQSHLLQLLAFLVMSMPSEINSETLHREKRHVFDDIKMDDLQKSVVRGQYTSGEVKGEMVAGYLDEDGVPDDSTTETFAAVRLFIDNLRWHGVPIYLRSGKRTEAKWTTIVIEFKQHELQKGSYAEIPPNKLIIQLQPNEKIEFKLLTKVGGTGLEFSELSTGRPIYCSGDCLHEHGRLLLETIRGNRLLFLSFEEIYAAWRVIDPLTAMFEKNEIPLEEYEAGSVGPKGANELIEQDGYNWHNFWEKPKK